MTRSSTGTSEKRGRRATNLSLDEALVDEARRAKINLSRAAERGIAEELAEYRQAAAEQWLTEHARTIADINEWVERNGLPLDKYRQF
jgi:antitoxin CcdA